MAKPPIPKQFYRYITVGSLAALNLAATGTQSSLPSFGIETDWVEVLEGRQQPTGEVSEFMLRVLGSPSRRQVEATAERHRRLVAPNAPSRATCVFVFGDPESAALAADRFGWDSTLMQTLVPRGSVRGFRADMEVVSIAQGAADQGHRIVEEAELWSRYWSGQPHLRTITALCGDAACRGEPWSPPEGPIWEWLVEGVLEVVTARP